MYKALIEKIFSFLTHHFELLIYISASLLFLSIVIALAVKLHDQSLRKVLLTTVRGVLFTSVLVGQFVLVIMLGYLYWQNYNKPVPELSLRNDMNATTRWIKDDTKIYFIDKNALRSIWINGKNERLVYQSESPITEYHFSPNGEYIAVISRNDLVLINSGSRESRIIDSLRKALPGGEAVSDNSVSGTISGVHWSPDSRRFSYEIARWSKFGSQDKIYIYSVEEGSKASINSPVRRISSLYWDVQGENLYFLRHETQDPTTHASAFEVKVFRIALTTLEPEFITQIPYEHKSIPMESLGARGIQLFVGGSKLSFGLGQQEDHLVSENGPTMGIDDEDYLYFTNAKWFRHRLFKIPREKSPRHEVRYQYKGGDLIIDQIRWIPGGRYVIMDHKYLGVIVLEPESGQFGILVEANGQAFGWYQKIQP